MRARRRRRRRDRRCPAPAPYSPTGARARHARRVPGAGAQPARGKQPPR